VWNNKSGKVSRLRRSGPPDIEYIGQFGDVQDHHDLIRRVQQAKSAYAIVAWENWAL
jgi:hypothetical protein